MNIIPWKPFRAQLNNLIATAHDIQNRMNSQLGVKLLSPATLPVSIAATVNTSVVSVSTGVVFVTKVPQQSTGETIMINSMVRRVSA